MEVWHAHLEQRIAPHVHRDLVFHHTFHHVKAYLLYPPACACGPCCQCAAQRERIVLSLNVDFYNTAIRECQDVYRIAAIKYVLKIPEDGVLREDYANVYPLWLIREAFQKRVESREFQCVFELVIILLRLSKTYLSLCHEPHASLKEALEELVGSRPLAHVKKHDPALYFGGEKTCVKHWATYRSVAHVIAALGALEGPKDAAHSWDGICFDWEASQIEKFLGIAQAFREELLLLKTPNVKEKRFLRAADLLSLPSWIPPQEIPLKLDIFAEKREASWKTAVYIDPRERLRKRLEREEELP